MRKDRLRHVELGMRPSQDGVDVVLFSPQQGILQGRLGQVAPIALHFQIPGGDSVGIGFVSVAFLQDRESVSVVGFGERGRDARREIRTFGRAHCFVCVCVCVCICVYSVVERLSLVVVLYCCTIRDRRRYRYRCRCRQRFVFAFLFVFRIGYHAVAAAAASVRAAVAVLCSNVRAAFIDANKYVANAVHGVSEFSPPDFQAEFSRLFFRGVVVVVVVVSGSVVGIGGVNVSTRTSTCTRTCTRGSSRWSSR
mmetsp:Transcript_6816/g.13461  ORF Transcript_6816/g.13461 Transcript_6816/m.13461 type:complete len:252 (-) Transcript_6816:166-921(-)